MQSAARNQSPGTTVAAPITYSLDTGEKPVNETLEAGQVIGRRTGATERRITQIQDGRVQQAEFSLDVHGFVLVPHATAMLDFFDAAQLRTRYYAEVERLVREVSNAVRVVVFDHTLRTGDTTEQQEKKIREPVLWAHNDYTDWSGPQRLREILGDEAPALLQRRFAIIQVWRAIQPAIERNPLAIVDARSVKPDDFVRAERRYPDRVGETYQLKYNPAQRWFYFPRMQREEALVFKVFDSATDGRARFTPHTSFDDPHSAMDAPPRQSIEVRSFAFF
jgi:hypothetical protein